MALSLGNDFTTIFQL